jgi:hypothetical protein
MTFSIAASAQQGSFVKTLDEEYREPKAFGEFVYFMNPSTTSRKKADGTDEMYGLGRVRGGTASQPLGCYTLDKNHKFNSSYKDVPAELQQKWAYDLFHYCQNRGETFEAYRKIVGSPDSANAITRTAIKYDDQKDFADMWWRRHYPDYKGLAWMFQNDFINDAIVDGTNVWTYFVYEDNRGALTVTWKDELVYRAVDKK